MNKIDYLGLGKMALIDIFAFIIAFADIEFGLKIILLVVTIAYTFFKAMNEFIKFLKRNEKDTTNN